MIGEWTLEAFVPQNQDDPQLSKVITVNTGVKVHQYTGAKMRQL